MGLDWEEGVFRGLLRLSRLRRRAPPLESPGLVRLEAIQPRLAVLASVLAGVPLRLRPAEAWGGIDDTTLRLPASLALVPDPAGNLELYLLRTAIDAVRIRLGLHRDPPTGAGARSLDALRQARVAAAWLARELPGFTDRHAAACRFERDRRPAPVAALDVAVLAALTGGCPWDDVALARRCDIGAGGLGLAIWGDWLPAECVAPVTTTSDERQPNGGGTEVQAPPRDVVQQVALDLLADPDPPPQAPYDRTETADAYKGGSRDADGEDELQDHLDALRDCDLREVVRGGERAASLYRLDLRIDGAGGEVVDGPEAGIPYDEWDARKRTYRRGWCTVRSARPASGDPLWARACAKRHHRQIERLRRRIECQRMQLEPVGRQLDGEEVDLPAMIDEMAARQAGHGGDARLYARLARRRRELAVTVLIDVSLSTDAYVDGLRVLDVAREAVLMLGETAERLGDRLQILAFSSHTRTRCTVWEVRGWDEPWSIGAARLGGLEPIGYTRIGAALRHATAGLCRVAARRRLLLLISDGKATDYDRYEGRHGDADVRQALVEARRRGIHAHALAIDQCAREHLPAMFGAGHWHLMPRPSALPEVLASVYARLTAV